MYRHCDITVRCVPKEPKRSGNLTATFTMKLFPEQ